MKPRMEKIPFLYELLLQRYGPQGWWPLIDLDSCNPTKTGVVKGYHPGDYLYPKTPEQRFEIICGAILTQNTSWVQVEKALLALRKLGKLSSGLILSLSEEKLKAAIKPSGYFNQKAKTLKLVATALSGMPGTPARSDLLALKGIGPETADSIMLFAYAVPYFIVDTYTKRIFQNLGFLDEKKTSYNDIQTLVHDSLDSNPIVYQEYHALLVEHAKRHYVKKPYNDPLKKLL